MSATKIFETERLLLRPFSLEDVEANYQMNLDPEISKYTGDGGVVSREEIHKRIEKNVMGDYEKYGYGRYAVILKETDEYIGFSGLKYLEELNEIELGYRFLRKCWGKGIATEAGRPFIEYGFGELGLKKIIGLVLPGNVGSIRVLQKLGFQFEKTIIEDGEEALCYSLLKDSGGS